MPRRNDLQSILVIGSGPIIIGQACEFDYSGTQACKALKADGYKVVLVNSNPATIMTDPDTADKIYIEPIRSEVVEMIIARERPQALLPTLGGQVALNIAVDLAESGFLRRYGVELIGADLDVIKKAENRQLFVDTMRGIRLDVPAGEYIRNIEEGLDVLERNELPLIVRPSFTLGGSGGGIAYNKEEFVALVQHGLNQSPTHEILVEEYLLGWKEYELEVMRDRNDNIVIICSIENVDPMGVHTGDSITVAPAQTLTDKEYQQMRDASIAIIKEIGVETGGSNIQFAVNPRDGRMVVIEMNPRVSRSSALASKATGFPIAKIAARLSVGYTLDEIPNDITRKTLACFEPTIDYVVTKIPRWNFEKFPGADATLTSQMKSVGEAMAIGRTFLESLQKGIRSLEIGRYGLETDIEAAVDDESLMERLTVPNAERIFFIKTALERGFSVQEVVEATRIDPWFIHQIRRLVDEELDIRRKRITEIPEDKLRRLKRMGYSDVQLGDITGSGEDAVRGSRESCDIRPVFKAVDTCGGEFEAYTPYYYSTYEEEGEVRLGDRKKIVILGGGPNRIGQGIEFDYCCVQASFALKEEGYETIMINSNPETVSTDYDISDRLYFEPLTLEDVLNVIEVEGPDGVIVQFGGQTPLKLAIPLMSRGVPVIGTSPEDIDLAEDRDRFGKLLDSLGINQPERGTARTLDEAVGVAVRIGFPLLVRPSYVLGGRAMMVAYEMETFKTTVELAFKASPGHPVLIDRFLEDAFEVDVDAVSDGKDVYVGGVMQHIEEAGVHSGDSACVFPPYMISRKYVEEMKEITRDLALSLRVNGLINIQFAIKDEIIYVLEVNPRASRTIPFISKATGIPLARIGTKVMIGRSLKEMDLPPEPDMRYVAVKESVFPFDKFPGVDSLLGPEMRSTGEVMGIDFDFGLSFTKAQLAAGMKLPLSGTVFLSVNDDDKQTVLPVASRFVELGFEIIATKGTFEFLTSNNIRCNRVYKVNEGRPNIVDSISDKSVHLLINTPLGKKSQYDGYSVRRAALTHNVPYITTMSGAQAVVEGIDAIQKRRLTVRHLRDYW
jgi:carbamoyl-phosphate synthase large subunit